MMLFKLQIFFAIKSMFQIFELTMIAKFNISIFKVNEILND